MLSLYRTVLHRCQQRIAAWPPTVQGMFWVALSGFIFSVLNALLRLLSQQMPTGQAQFLRYFAGTLVMLPLLWRHGMSSYWPRDIKGQFWRGAAHTLALTLWFMALPHIPLADTTAISFTGPIYVMIGAAWFLGERMRADRWIAALIGLAGVMVVVAPKLSGEGGYYSLIMMASSPLFAASFLITKALTRSEKSTTIVLWQSLVIALLSAPLGLMDWQPLNLWQVLGFAVAGALGSYGHYCMAQGFGLADISATQSLRFLDLVWTSALGWLMFASIPSTTTWLGAAVIMGSTLWITQREKRRR
ncbi:MAG: DMT family transporter [Betaproteobacteria bacterium]|jgi:drug/metabolite transporter (DMT)-like permease|nr:DMT family transporter [Betaproteobacteria bacterium]NBP45969.1 DMT family transporter [Betaproteobacteria bacterium]